MPDTSQAEAPEFRDWSVAAVRLLQGIVYSDDVRAWDALLRSRSTLEAYFARLALQLVVDEPEGYAYLRQWSDDEYPSGYEEVPKLVRRIPLGYGTTLLCVLLRDELRRFEDTDLHNDRCVVEEAPLFDQWKVFFQSQQDEVRQRRQFAASLGKLAELGFVNKFTDEPASWEVRRILKARLPITELENLKKQLSDFQAGFEERPSGDGSHG